MATENVTLLINAQDNASGVLKSLANNINSGALAASGFLATVGVLGKNMIGLAADMEQTGVAFKTLLGNADVARKVLNDLSDFARSTPFDLPQVQQGAQRLLTYGITADDLIPTFKMLGDISAGNADKLNSLTLAYGQVKAATKLTGGELRQFSEAGVPLLEALVNQANEAGGVLTKVGGASKETTKKMAGLASKIASTEFEMKFFKETGGKTDEQLQSMQKTIDLNKAKLGQFGDAGQAVYARVKVSAKDMIDKISDGAVSFDDVNKALQGMTQEGGKFFNMMEEQSKTFSGRISNIKDTWVRFAAAVIGVNAAGEVQDGSIFAVLSDGAKQLLDGLEKIQQPISDFISSMLKNKDVVNGIIGAFGGLLALIGISFISTFGAAIGIAVAFAAGGVLLYNAFLKIKDLFSNFSFSGIFDKFPAYQGYVNELSGQVETFWERLKNTFKLEDGGGLVGYFQQSKDKVLPILNDLFAQIKQGFTNSLNINFGEGGNIADLLGRLLGIALNVSDIFFRMLTPAFEGLKESFVRAKPEIDVLLQQLGPILIDTLQILAGVLAFVIGVFLMLFTGIVNGVSWAIPYMVQAFSGLAEFIRGIMDIIVGIFTLNFAQIWSGIKALFNSFWDITVGTLGAIVMFIGGFVGGVINFFKNLYDVLIGHSIIPDLVNGIINWFMTLDDKVIGVVSGLISTISSKFWGLVSSAGEWGKQLIGNLVGGIKDRILGAGRLAETILGGLGINMSDLLSFDTGGIVPGPINQPQLAMVHGGERITPVGRADSGGSGGGGGLTLNVNIGLYAGSEAEKRNVARELYGALSRLAQSQNKTVTELMGN